MDVMFNTINTDTEYKMKIYYRPLKGLRHSKANVFLDLGLPLLFTKFTPLNSLLDEV